MPEAGATESPVPPCVVAAVPIKVLKLMPREEVAMATAFPRTPVLFPTSELAATCWNFAYVTALLAIVVEREPPGVVTSPVKAGNAAACKVPVTFE